VIAQVRDTLEGDEEAILAAMRTLERALRTTLE
jgi:hypothetical protein